MGTKRSTWSRIAGILAAIAASALAIVTIDMIVDDWFDPTIFTNATILIQCVLAAVSATLFFTKRPLWGLITVGVAFIVGQVLGRVFTDGNGILWPFRALPDLGLLAEISPLWAIALVCLDIAFITMLGAVVTGFVATLMGDGSATAASQPDGVMVGASAQQGIPAGWYRDPEGKPCQRYWDGTAWTDATAPLA